MPTSKPFEGSVLILECQTCSRNFPTFVSSADTDMPIIGLRSLTDLALNRIVVAEETFANLATGRDANLRAVKLVRTEDQNHGRAPNFDDALLEQRFVSDVVVAHEFACPLTEESASVMTTTAFGKVVYDDRLRIVLGGAIAPQVGSVRAPQAGLGHRDGGLIGVQNRSGEQLCFKRQPYRLEPHTADAHL
jgi:hypothetical protein